MSVWMAIVLAGMLGVNSVNSLYDLSVTNIQGELVPLGQFRGKVALVVNTASRCGFTSQFKGLEELYQKYKDRGFVVLGFPSNDFMRQEPGNNEEIKKFCELNYGVSFPLFRKASVKGKGKQEVYRFLTEQAPRAFQGDPGWNFVKFLVNQEGQVVDRFTSMVGPMQAKVVKAIEAQLAKGPSQK